MRFFARHDSSLWQRNNQPALEEPQKRTLMYITFLCTGLVLPIFAIAQFYNNHFQMAVAELVIGVLSLLGAYRIRRTHNIRPWIIGFLVPAFAFFVYIVVKPEASLTAFVWIYMIPLMTYLLLGRVMGFLVSVPLMVFVAAYMALQMMPMDNARGWIDLLNPILCGAMVLLFVHLYESMRATDQARLATMASTDALTGLANRNSFQAALERTIQESRRSNVQFALVLMDVDHFKTVNDTYGHAAGDEALKFICRRLTQRLRCTDVIGRLGGEEFGIILRDVDGATAYGLTEKLRIQLAESEMLYDGNRINLTATFGIGHWPYDAHEAGRLYRVADTRLYEGKAMGRNTTVIENNPPNSGFVTAAERAGL